MTSLANAVTTQVVRSSLSHLWWPLQLNMLQAREAFTKESIRKLSDKQSSPSKTRRQPGDAGTLVASNSFQSTVSASGSGHGVRTGNLSIRQASKTTQPSHLAANDRGSVLQELPTNPTTPPYAETEASFSGASTAVPTPTTLSFSAPIAVTGLRKHRPAPLDLTDSGSGQTLKAAMQSGSTIDK